MRVVARHGEPGQAERARYLLDGLDILPLAKPVIALAETIGPPTLRSLDAIHLAAAAQIKRELTAFVGRLPRGRHRNRITRRRSRVTVPPTRRPALSRQSGSGCCCQLGFSEAPMVGGAYRLLSRRNALQQLNVATAPSVGFGARLRVAMCPTAFTRYALPTPTASSSGAPAGTADQPQAGQLVNAAIGDTTAATRSHRSLPSREATSTTFACAAVLRRAGHARPTRRGSGILPKSLFR